MALNFSALMSIAGTRRSLSVACAANIASLVAAALPKYSASVVESATVGCRQLDQLLPHHCEGRLSCQAPVSCVSCH